MADEENVYFHSRHNSTASINELVGTEEDKSLARAGEDIRVSECEDEKFNANAYKYCSKNIRGSWAACSPEKFTVQYVRYVNSNFFCPEPCRKSICSDYVIFHISCLFNLAEPRVFVSQLDQSRFLGEILVCPNLGKKHPKMDFFYFFSLFYSNILHEVSRL